MREFDLRIEKVNHKYVVTVLRHGKTIGCQDDPSLDIALAKCHQCIIWEIKQEPLD